VPFWTTCMNSSTPAPGVPVEREDQDLGMRSVEEGCSMMSGGAEAISDASSELARRGRAAPRSPPSAGRRAGGQGEAGGADRGTQAGDSGSAARSRAPMTPRPMPPRPNASHDGVSGVGLSGFECSNSLVAPTAPTCTSTGILCVAMCRFMCSIKALRSSGSSNQIFPLGERRNPEGRTGKRGRRGPSSGTPGRTS